MTHLLNLTPHPLRLHGPEGVVVELAPDGPAPRLNVERVPLGVLAGLPIVRSTMGSVEGLPPPAAGVVLVVSALVAEAGAERSDLAYPGEAIRDEGGRVVGARGLCAGPGLAARLAREAAAAEAAYEAVTGRHVRLVAVARDRLPSGWVAPCGYRREPHDADGDACPGCKRPASEHEAARS